MGLTTERKVFLGLAIVAGIALVVDQGILAPKSASADALPPGIDSVPLAQVSSDPSPDPVQSSQQASTKLIDRLKTFPSTELGASFGSSFSLTQMIPAKVDEVQTDPQDQGSAQGDSDNSFPLIAPSVADLPTLSSVMPSANGGGAVLGGKLLRVGQVGPNGYRLVLVHARAVLVERDGVQYAIEMPRISGHD